MNSTTTDIYGLRIDGLNSERIFGTWVDGVANAIEGVTVANLAPTDYTQAVYKVFGTRDSTAPGTVYAAANTPAVIPETGAFRVRMLIRVGGGGADIGRDSFKLQYATSTIGGCDSSFSGETYFDVATSTGAVRYFNNPTPADGAALTSTSTDPTDGLNNIVNQTYEEQNNFTNSVAKIFGGEDGKWDFSLQVTSTAPLSTFCFRIVKSNDSLLDSYLSPSIAEVTTNATPSMADPTVHGGTPITLIEGTTTIISVTSTITDLNGSSDIYGARGSLFRTSLGRLCTADNNNCYSQASCNFTSCSGNICDVSCDFPVWYFAEPTDTGTPWAGDTWSGWIEGFDTLGATSTATSTNGMTLYSLLALNAPSTIDYGSFLPGLGMATLTVSSVVSSTGNVSMDTTLYGTNMISGINSIAVGQQHYATSSISYASGAILLANPGSTIEMNIPKTISSVTPATTTLYWGISVPTPQPTGLYSGSAAFIGVMNSLPWP